MKLPGICDICARPGNLFGCMMCGSNVCQNCFVNEKGLCKKCYERYKGLK